jgi:integrase/recombinase XerD
MLVRIQKELWDLDEILFIIKFEPHIRNKAALTLVWDLGARNHEVTLSKIKHIRDTTIIQLGNV